MAIEGVEEKTERIEMELAKVKEEMKRTIRR